MPDERSAKDGLAFVRGIMSSAPTPIAALDALDLESRYDRPA
jgi:hypothetical protein